MVEAIDHEGVKHQIPWNPGRSLMQSLCDSGLPVPAICGGNCICATCHVYVDERTFAALGPRSEAEFELLQGSLAFEPGSSRLSCQIHHSSSLAGIKVTLAPYD